MPRSRISGAIGGRGLTCRRGRQQPYQHPSQRLHTVAVEANIEPVHPHDGHSSDRKRCPGGPHTCEHQRTHAGLSSTRQCPPTACTPSLAAALVGAPQQRLASAKSAASTKLWKRPVRPPTRCLGHAAHSGALAATRRGCDRRSGPGPVHHRRTPLVAVKPWRCAPASQRHKLLRLQNMRPGQWDSIQLVVISQDDYEIISESHSRPRMHAARCRSDRLTVHLRWLRGHGRGRVC